jgi:hypothetical protein
MSVDVFKERFRCAEDYSHSLPFNPDEAVNHIRLEKYMDGARGRNVWRSLVRNVYYRLRPFMGVAFRKHLQRAYLKRWEDIVFPHWPVDRTVECIFESLAMLALKARGEAEMPFAWFWPKGCSGCVIITHDIETAAGRDFAPQLADIDASFGFKPSFQVVPEESYEVTGSFLESLRARGCEINLHGLNHDGRLFEDRRRFVESARRINRYADEYGAAGFRSPVLYRNLDWYGEFGFSYDMSVPNCAHLDPQRGGCCTVMPYFIGNIVELPLTTTQDYSLFHILRRNSIGLWKEQIDLILEKHGLISFNVHPDYIIEQRHRDIYRELLDYLMKICEARKVWIALPGEVDRWWRERGTDNERAVIAWAAVERGKLKYNVTGQTASFAGGNPCVSA